MLTFQDNDKKGSFSGKVKGSSAVKWCPVCSASLSPTLSSHGTWKIRERFQQEAQALCCAWKNTLSKSMKWLPAFWPGPRKGDKCPCSCIPLFFGNPCLLITPSWNPSFIYFANFLHFLFVAILSIQCMQDLCRLNVTPYGCICRYRSRNIFF